MRYLDFSTWQGLLSTLLGLAIITLIGVGIRLVVMQTLQQRRERENRQINERLRTLIAAYKVLGGSFTGRLEVDPTHLRDLRRTDDEAAESAAVQGSERGRRIRDAVEAALSDIILLGTEAQVRMAAQAAADLAAGRSIQTDELVVSLRDFIRQALNLEPVPAGGLIPRQGPARPAAAASRGRGAAGGEAATRGGGGKGGGAGGGGGAAMGAGLGLGSGIALDDGPDGHR